VSGTEGRRARRARAALAAAGLLFAVAQATLALTPAAGRPDFRDGIYAHKHAILAAHVRARAAAAGRPPAFILALGTSHLELGLDALTAEAELDRAGSPPAAVVNFALSASGPVVDYFYLRRLLGVGPPPDRLLLEVIPTYMRDGAPPQEQVFVTAGRLTPRERRDAVLRYGFDPNRFPTGPLDGCFPAYEMRGALMRRLLPLWVPVGQEDRDLADRRGEIDPAGWRPCPWEESLPRRQALADRSAAAVRPFMVGFRVGGPCWVALCDTILLARGHNIPVTLILPPEARTYRATYPSEMAAELYDRLAWACKLPGVELVDAWSWAPDELFLDGHHLTREGARTFSERLSREVLLPRLRPRVTPPAVSAGG
jgi:hypothetical protein